MVDCGGGGDENEEDEEDALKKKISTVDVDKWVVHFWHLKSGGGPCRKVKTVLTVVVVQPCWQQQRQQELTRRAPPGPGFDRQTSADHDDAAGT